MDGCKTRNTPWAILQREIKKRHLAAKMKDFKLLSITRDFFASVVGLELERAQFFGTRALFGFGFGARVELEPENIWLSGSDLKSFFFVVLAATS